MSVGETVWCLSETDIVEQIARMAQLGCVRCQDIRDDNVMSLSYVTSKVKEKLRGLPKFSLVEH